MKEPDFSVQWLNDLNRAAQMQQDIRLRALDELGYPAYQALNRAAVELDMAINEHRKRLSKRCQPWFEVTK